MRQRVVAIIVMVCAMLAQTADRAVAQPQNAVPAFIESMPRIADVYARKMLSVAEETGRDPATLEQTPTLLAVRGLVALRAGEQDKARAAASALLQQRQDRKGAAFFPFRFDYAGPWPYRLEAPWVSALSQGLALALFDGLAAAGIAEFAPAAKATAQSFAVPMEEGGFTRFEGDTAFFEEYPLAVPTRVLNGGLIATLALGDFLTRQPDGTLQPVREAGERWWRRHGARYSTVSPEWPGAVSAYSLAPSREEVLFRFIGPAHGDIVRLALAGAGGEPSVIEAGGNGDDRTDNDGYLWINPKFQNWGERQSTPFRARTIINGQGQYGHAPFSLVMKGAAPGKAFTLTVTGRAKGPETLAVQVFDGQEYHAIGVLERAEKPKDHQFALPPAALANLLNAQAQKGPPIQSSYFYDNARLMELLAARLADADLARLAARWMEAAALVPGWTDARPMPARLAGGAAPLLEPKPGTSESAALAYPALARHGGSMQMIYAAEAADKRWRLFLATSGDGGQSWTRQGGIFDDAKVPFLSATQPHLVHDERNGRYLLYFSATAQASGAAETIQVAETADFLSFRLIGAVAARGGRAPAIWREEGRFVMLSSVTGAGNVQTLLRQVSVDGLVWSAPEAVHASVGPAGPVTHAPFPLEGRMVMLADRAPTRERQELVLYCRGADGHLITPLSGPVDVVDIKNPAWDQHRYGVKVLPGDDGLTVYYSGARLDRPAEGGRIGRGQMTFSADDRKAVAGRCRL